jgi:hypothetical protein
MNNVFQREKKTTHLNLAISRAGPPIPHPTSNTFTNQKVYVKITPINKSHSKEPCIIKICRIEDLSTALASVPKNKSQPGAVISEILKEQFNSLHLQVAEQVTYTVDALPHLSPT